MLTASVFGTLYIDYNEVLPHYISRSVELALTAIAVLVWMGATVFYSHL